MTDLDDLRYGVFLVPDARTSAAITDITTYLQAQFGLMSAGRFPPHVTLAGSLPLGVEEGELLTAIAAVADRHAPIQLTNSGVHRLTTALVYDIHHDHDGAPNPSLVDLAADVNNAVRGLLRPTEHLPADVHHRDDWRGHLSLASHELDARADLREEVREFIDDLAVPHPTAFRATRMAVYRLHHRDWSPGWWTTFTWEHLRSFPLRQS